MGGEQDLTPALLPGKTMAFLAHPRPWSVSVSNRSRPDCKSSLHTYAHPAELGPLGPDPAPDCLPFCPPYRTTRHSRQSARFYPDGFILALLPRREEISCAIQPAVWSS